MSFLHQINPLALILVIQRRRPLCIYGVFHFNSPGSSHSADNGLLAFACACRFVSVCHLSCKILFLPGNYCIYARRMCRVSVSPSASRREISHCEWRRLLSRRPICIQLGSARQLTLTTNNNNRLDSGELFLHNSPYQRGRLCVLPGFCETI